MTSCEIGSKWIISGALFDRQHIAIPSISPRISKGKIETGSGCGGAIWAKTIENIVAEVCLWGSGVDSLALFIVDGESYF